MDSQDYPRAGRGMPFWKRLMVFLSVLALGLLLATPVITQPANQGRDVSYADNSGSRHVEICDHETDGRKAYVRFDANTLYNVDYDENGSDPGCGFQYTSGNYIHWHQACEPVAGCGSRSPH